MLEINYEHKIDENIDQISNQINTRINKLKNELDKLNVEYQQKLKDLRIQLKK